MKKYLLIFLSAMALLFSERAIAQSIDFDVELKSVNVPAVVEKGKPFQIIVSIVNWGRQYASNIDVEFSVNDKDCGTYTGSISPAIGAAGTANVVINDVMCDEVGQNLIASIKIVKVNGNDDGKPENNSTKKVFSCLEKTYAQKVVVEEWTGTWCKWCVRGIVSMEYMKEKYADEDFIGIAVHARDEMASTSFSGFISKYAASYPGSIINRQIVDNSTEKSGWESNYNIVRMSRSIAEVNVNAWYDENNPNVITAISTTTFGIDKENARYKISHVIVEDQVGPYAQSNAYAWGSTEMGGWENKSNSVMWLYDDVARETDSWNGAKNSIPNVIVKLKPYHYTSELSTAYVSNINNCYIISLLIDTDSGAIVNACKSPILFGEPEYIDEPDEPEEPSEDANISESSNYLINIRTENNRIILEGDVKEYKIYSIDGIIVASGDIAENTEVASGIYIVEARDFNGRTIKRKILI